MLNTTENINLPSLIQSWTNTTAQMYTTDGAGNTSNSSYTMVTTPAAGPISWDDATWILACSFIIFTMQSGFGLLEAGCVSAKNEVNIMVKNAADVIFGGLTYWMFGYGLSFGEDKYSNWFVGVGKFFLDSDDEETMGLVFATYIFQLSFATTATTIVSGAMAERTRLDAYMIYSLVNTVVYCVPAHWLWGNNGFLKILGAIDIAGSGGVHLVGGVSGLIATNMLGPRTGRYDGNFDTGPGNATNMVVGMFMLWWGWLGFNCGSTFGISGGKWKLAAKSAVTTLNSSMGGGIVGILYSYITKSRKYDVPDMVNAILGALVSVTAGCAILRPWEAVVIGMVGGILAVLGLPFFDWLKIDDPVGALSVHGLCGLWGMLAVGLFVDEDTIENMTSGRRGLFKGGGWYLLGVQFLACVSIIIWSAVVTYVILKAIDLTMGLRMSAEEERIGADVLEHGIRPLAGHDPNLPFGGRRSSFGFVRHDMQANEVNGTTRIPSHNGTIRQRQPDTETEEGNELKEIVLSIPCLTEHTLKSNGHINGGFNESVGDIAVTTEAGKEHSS